MSYTVLHTWADGREVCRVSTSEKARLEYDYQCQ